MKRDPSIHITLSSLVSILSELGYENSAALADDIALKAYSKAVQGRNFVMKTPKREKKIQKLLSNKVAPDIVSYFNLCLYTARKQAGHKGIEPISATDSNYNQMCDIASSASKFSQELFGDPKEGIARFIEMGFGFMKGKYALSKFSYYKERIYETARMLKEINSDTNQIGTFTLYTHWQRKMKEQSNVELDLTNKPEQYIAMLYSRKSADEVKVTDYGLWIDAQFARFDFLDTVPHINSLYGSEAQLAYATYMKAHKPKHGTKFASKAEEEYYKRYLQG